MLVRLMWNVCDILRCWILCYNSRERAYSYESLGGKMIIWSRLFDWPVFFECHLCPTMEFGMERWSSRHLRDLPRNFITYSGHGGDVNAFQLYAQQADQSQSRVLPCTHAGHSVYEFVCLESWILHRQLLIKARGTLSRVVWGSVNKCCNYGLFDGNVFDAKVV